MVNLINFNAVNVEIEKAKIAGVDALRVIKPLSNTEPDTDTYAEYKDSWFHNGTITVRMYAQLQNHAPKNARGFIGIVFRAKSDHSEFESFYIRPTNGNHSDPVRRSHGCQYFSYPGYTFAYFRKHQIMGFEHEANIALKEWINLKAVINGEKAAFFVNDMNVPVLTVDHLKHGDSSGLIGLYVDNGTDGYFSDIVIEKED